MAKNPEVHLLASFVHGCLSGLHLLGVVYNIRRKNKFDIAAHVLGVAYSVHATAHHIKCVKETTR